MEKIILEIYGLGIIMYSNFSVINIEEYSDYFSQNYLSPEQVLPHIYNGTIVGFCTGSPGTFHLNIKEGYPEGNKEFNYSLRLGIEIRDNIVTFRDLYDLMEWESNCNETQSIHLENGFYHLTLGTNIPISNIIGDNQVIDIYFNKVNEMPKLKYNGIPCLCD